MKGIGKDSLHKYFRRYRLQVICVAAGFIIFALLTFMENGSASGEAGRAVRNGYISSVNRSVTVKGLEDEEVTVDYTVSARRFSDDEIDKAFSDCFSRVLEEMRGDNESLSEVCYDLNLMEKMRDYGFKLTWISDDPDMVSSSGEVKNGSIEEPEEVSLRVVISDGEREAVFPVDVTVYPEKLSPSEKIIKDFKSEIESLDKATITKEGFDLPAEYDNRKLTYSGTDKKDYNVVWILGILLAVLLTVREKESLKEKQSLLQKQLEADYPEIVSKLLVFVGAGMNIRLSFNAVVSDYEERRKRGETQERFAYEEMARANTRLKTGTPEAKVYKDFGRNCRSKHYMKLAGLLEQSRRSGVANLRDILQMESMEAWEERKNRAKRQGEEASTKLLLPLIMMLGVVMIMIMVPALMSF